MPLLELKLLGDMSLKLDGEPLPQVKTQKGKALLCYLAVSQRSVPRPVLAALFWPEMPEARARRNLRKVLQRLGPLKLFLVISRETLAFNQDTDNWIDVMVFESGTAKAHDVAGLRAAVAIYQGDFLAGLSLDGIPLFEDWVLAQRARLRETAALNLQRLIDAAANATDPEMAISYCRQRLALDPWHEATHRELMRQLAQAGESNAALASYEDYRRFLSDELGLAPETATRQLAERIKAGEWRRQDKSHPSKMGSASLDNLPPQLTPFVGRGRELARLRHLLAESDIRLITILGPGGIGKTRLALALAAEQKESLRQPFAHGIYYMSLAHLASADMLAQGMAEALNFQFNEQHDHEKQLLRYLANKTMLLVLDNFEHLLAGADLVEAILRAAPHIKIVLTTRERLNRQFEQVFPVEGMTYPPENIAYSDDREVDFCQFGAVQLFEQRARRLQPNFRLTTANQNDVFGICRLLQGMPLGIVLSAAWLDVLSPGEIRREIARDIDFLKTEMEDVPARQRSLRAAFNHSWQLLSAREQELFCQTSIFRGGFSRAAAKKVTGADLHDLQGLVNKSLLTMGSDGRYDIHVLLRQFAAAKLTTMGDLAEAVRDCHRDFYCALLQQHAGSWENQQQLQALSDVTREAENVQLAWRRAMKQEKWSLLAQSIDSVGWYHKWRSLHAEGEALCREICRSAERWVMTGPANAGPGYLVWAKAKAWHGVFTIPIKVATRRMRQSLDLSTRPGVSVQDKRAIRAFALLQLGERLTLLDRHEARSCLEESLRSYQALPESGGTARALRSLGYLDWCAGDYSLALSRVESSLAMQQRLGDRMDQIHTLDTLGWIYQHKGRLAEAEDLRHQILDLCQQLGDRSSAAFAMATLSYSVTFQGRFAMGREWGKKSLKLCEENGNLRDMGYVRLAIGISWLLSGHYAEAGTELWSALDATRAVDSIGVEASVHCWLGYLALAQRAYDEAWAAFVEGYRLYQAVQGDAYTFLALSGLGLTACCLRDLERSSSYIVELLTEGLERKDYFFLLFALPGLTQLLLRWGEVERAASVWAHAQGHSYVANSQLCEELVGRDVEGAITGLPPGVLKAAQSRGRSQDLWQITTQLLGELSTRHSN